MSCFGESLSISMMRHYLRYAQRAVLAITKTRFRRIIHKRVATTA